MVVLIYIHKSFDISHSRSWSLISLPLNVSWTWWLLKKKKRFYLFIFREGGGKEKHQCVRDIDQLPLTSPNWGPGLQPRHVPWLGNQRPFRQSFAGRSPTHWATLVKALGEFFFLMNSIWKEENDNFIVEKPDRHYFKQVITSNKYVDIQNLIQCNFPWYNAMRKALHFCGFLPENL